VYPAGSPKREAFAGRKAEWRDYKTKIILKCKGRSSDIKALVVAQP